MKDEYEETGRVGGKSGIWGSFRLGLSFISQGIVERRWGFGGYSCGSWNILRIEGFRGNKGDEVVIHFGNTWLCRYF